MAIDPKQNPDSTVDLGIASSSPAPLEPAVDDASRYKRAAEIGRGGLGRVLEAHDRRLDRPVAIKELLHPGTELRFHQEALITARLEHPAIIPIHDAGVEHGRPFYAMKRVTGRTLAELASEATTVGQRLALLEHVVTVCDALGYAHSRNIIHRDLKPQNVLVGSFGETVVIDWGIAKDLGSAEDPKGAAHDVPESQLTMVGAVVGTPAYMAPEQAAGGAIDARADVFAIGALLHYVLTGSNGRTVVLVGQLGIATDLVAIVAKALESDPAGRYANASELGADLRKFMTGQLVSAHRYSRGERLRRLVRRHRAAVIVGVIAIVAIGVISVAALGRVIAARDRETTKVIELRWLQARADLDRSPSRTLGWLRSLVDTEFDQWSAARVIAADAAARGVPHLLAALEPSTVVALDDTAVVMSLSDGRILRLDVATGAEKVLYRHRTRANGLAYDPTSRTLASASDDGIATIIDLETQRVRELRHPGVVEGVVIRSDGMIATAGVGGVRLFGRDGTPGLHHATTRPARWVNASAHGWVFRTETQIEVADDSARRVVLDVPGGEIFKLELSPDRARLAVAHSQHPGIEIIELGDGARRKISLGTGMVTGIAWDPSGHRVAIASVDRDVRIVDLVSGEIVVAPTRFGSRSLRASEELLAVAGSDGVVRLISWRGALIGELRGHGSSVFSLVWGPSRRWLISADDHVLRWDLEPIRGTPVAIDQLDGVLGEKVRDLEHEGGSSIATLGSTLVAIDGDQVRVLTKLASKVTALAAAGEGRVIAGSKAGEVAIFDLAGNLVATRPLGEDPDDGIEDLAVDRARGVALAITYRSRVVLLRLPTLETIHSTRSIEPGATADFAAGFLLDGSLVVGNYDGTIRIHDRVSGHELRRLAGIIGITELAISPDGMLVATCGPSNRIELIEIASGHSRFLEGHINAVHAVEFSPDGRSLASASADGTVRLWDVNSGFGRSIPRAHEVVRDVAWAPDSKSVEAVADGTLHRIRDDLVGGPDLFSWLRTHPDVSGVDRP